MRRIVVGIVIALVAGCTALVDLDGLDVPKPDAPPEEAGIDAAFPDAPTVIVVKDAGLDAPPPKVDAGPTRVACAEPSSCADREGCCIVYGPSEDFCADAPSKCTFGSSPTVFITCDDAQDCAALGHPGTICCAEIDVPDGRFTSVSCRPAAQCNGVQLCDAIKKQCPDGKTCKKGNYASDTWVCE